MEGHYTYIDEKGKAHKVHIHNFSKSEPDMVRIMGNIELNPSDTTGYPDKKWVKKSEVLEVEIGTCICNTCKDLPKNLVPATFSERFIKNNSFN